MYYESREEWLEANTRSAYEIAEALDEEQKEELTNILDFLKHEITTRDNILNWMDAAIDDVVDKDVKDKINQMYMMRMHNGFLETEPLGRELKKMGVKPRGIMAFFKEDE